MKTHLTGLLICTTEDEAARVRAYLPEHIRLTRAEPGCEMFEVTPEGPLVWRVTERFTDRAAFAAHQSRTQGSEWARQSAGIRRDFTLTQG